MVVQKLVRPVFLMIVGWYLATRRMLLKHSDGLQPGVVMMHPAYAFFYTMFAGIVFVLLFQKDSVDANDNFGFLSDPASARRFFVRAAAVCAAQTLTAYLYAWFHRPKTDKIKNAKDMRSFVARYALYSLVAGIAAIGIMVLADLFTGDGDAGEIAK